MREIKFNDDSRKHGKNWSANTISSERFKAEKKFRLVGEQEAAPRSVKDNEKNGIKILKGFWDSGDEI